MKTIRNAFLSLVLMFIPLFLYASDAGNMYLKLVEGDVQIKIPDTEDWVIAAINTPIYEGDNMWAPDGGRAELQLADGTLLRFDNNTSLEVLAVEQDVFQFFTAEGHLYVNVRGPKGQVLAIETPTASVRAYDKSKFRIDVTDQGDSQVSVIAGELFIERPSGEMKINAGDRLVLRKDQQYPELARLQPPDPWDQWNKQRDKDFYDPRPDQGVAYLPEELRPYSPDFEQNGHWVNTSEYGYVWTPTVVVSTGWAPYRVGRWVWIRGDYVWVSYEPWGWAPYHYGRWAHVNSLGWCWVPPARGAVHWGPGYVGWVHTPTHVAWVPLAPRETYYGYGNYGPYSVNITKVHTDNTVVKTVYKNVYVNNAVTKVHRDTFITGRPIRVEPVGDLFLRERVVAGAPRIKPVRATVMPVIREVPQYKLPPQKIRDMEAKKIISSRPLLREHVERTGPNDTGRMVLGREMPRNPRVLNIDKGRNPIAHQPLPASPVQTSAETRRALPPMNRNPNPQSGLADPPAKAARAEPSGQRPVAVPDNRREATTAQAHTPPQARTQPLRPPQIGLQPLPPPRRQVPVAASEATPVNRVDPAQGRAYSPRPLPPVREEMNYPAASHGASKARQGHQNLLEASFGVSTRGAMKPNSERIASRPLPLPITPPAQPQRPQTPPTAPVRQSGPPRNVAPAQNIQPPSARPVQQRVQTPAKPQDQHHERAQALPPAPRGDNQVAVNTPTREAGEGNGARGGNMQQTRQLPPQPGR